MNKAVPEKGKLLKYFAHMEKSAGRFRSEDNTRFFSVREIGHYDILRWCHEFLISYGV